MNPNTNFSKLLRGAPTKNQKSNEERRKRRAGSHHETSEHDDAKMFDRLGKKYPVAYNSQKNLIIRMMSSPKFECVLSNYDLDTLKLIFHFLSYMSSRFESISLEDAIGLRGRRRRPSFPTTADISSILDKKLSKVISKATSLQKLELIGLTLRTTTYKSIGKELLNCEKMHEIYIEGCNVGDKGLKALSTALGRLPLRRLTLTRTRLTGKSGDTLHSIISQHMMSRDVHKWAHSLRDIAKPWNAKEHYEIQHQVGGLVVLDLTMNFLGDEGVRGICEALVHDTWLAGLDLRKNMVGNKGLAALLRVLEENQSLLRLEVTPNDGDYTQFRTGTEPIKDKRKQSTHVGPKERKTPHLKMALLEELHHTMNTQERVDREMSFPLDFQEMLVFRDLDAKQNPVLTASTRNPRKSRPLTAQKPRGSRMPSSAIARRGAQPLTADEATMLASLNQMLIEMSNRLESQYQRELKLEEENKELKQQLEEFTTSSFVLPKLPEADSLNISSDNEEEQQKIAELLYQLESSFLKLSDYMTYLESTLTVVDQHTSLLTHEP